MDAAAFIADLRARAFAVYAADSPRRVMAALKADGKLNYELVNRSQSLYRVAAMEAA